MSKNYTGIGRYASRLIDALKEIDRHNRYVLYAPKGIFDYKRSVPAIAGVNIDLKIDRFKRGLKRTVGKIDIYHALSPEVFDIEDCKVIVTVHDLVYKAFPEGHTQETLRLSDEQFQFFLPRTDRFICCSNNTAEDLKKYFAVSLEKISVVYPGVDQKVFKRYTDEQKQAARSRLAALGISRPFILFVGTLEPRKNLNNLIRAYSILREKKKYEGQLVVAGMRGWNDESTIDRALLTGLKDHIKLTGFLPDEDLGALYNTTDVFAFPSLYEGFGYPIVEAFSCGAPVVTSDRASCKEVAGDAALCVDPQDPSKIAEALGKIIEDKQLRHNLMQRGEARAKQFSQINCAQNTLKVYKKVYEN